MKAGIITFQETNNYGAILQSYALQKSIKKLGHEVEVIDYKCNYIRKPYHISNLKKKGITSYLFGVIGYICYMPRTKNAKIFRKYMKYSKPYVLDNIKEANKEYDTFITGSDQVWNYKLTNSDNTYLLDFVQDSKKKNSYAASIGLNELSPIEQKRYGESLRDFNKILVREAKAKEIIEGVCNNEVATVLDPTFLLSKEEWNDVAIPPTREDKYILVYQLGISKRMINFVKALSKTTGYKVKYIPFPIIGTVKCSLTITAGPAEWLGLFQKAEYIITDSFHGTVFSILFNKKFFSEICDQNSGVGSRIDNLLKLFELENRLISENSLSMYEKEINYEIVNQILEKERNNSYAYLEKIFVEE